MTVSWGYRLLKGNPELRKQNCFFSDLLFRKTNPYFIRELRCRMQNGVKFLHTSLYRLFYDPFSLVSPINSAGWVNLYSCHHYPAASENMVSIVETLPERVVVCIFAIAFRYCIYRLFQSLEKFSPSIPEK